MNIVSTQRRDGKADKCIPDPGLTLRCRSREKRTITAPLLSQKKGHFVWSGEKKALPSAYNGRGAIRGTSGAFPRREMLSEEGGRRGASRETSEGLAYLRKRRTILCIEGRFFLHLGRRRHQ